MEEEAGIVGPVDAELKKSDGTAIPVRIVARPVRKNGETGWCVNARRA